MKTIHKLVLKSYLGPMFLTFFIVMFVLMMNFIWRYIDELVGKGLDAGVIIELMSYAMANMIPMGLPLAMLLAAIMTLGNLGENYELLAMKSAGSMAVCHHGCPFCVAKMSAVMVWMRTATGSATSATMRDQRAEIASTSSSVRLAIQPFRKRLPERFQPGSSWKYTLRNVRIRYSVITTISHTSGEAKFGWMSI